MLTSKANEMNWEMGVFLNPVACLVSISPPPASLSTEKLHDE